MNLQPLFFIQIEDKVHGFGVFYMLLYRWMVLSIQMHTCPTAIICNSLMYKKESVSKNNFLLLVDMINNITMN